MPLSSDQLSVVRSWVGELPTDGDLNARYDRLFALQTDMTYEAAEARALELTIEESLRKLMTTLMLDRPPRFTLPNGLSMDYSSAISALKDWMAAFKKEGLEGTKPMRVSRLRRCQTR